MKCFVDVKMSNDTSSQGGDGANDNMSDADPIERCAMVPFLFTYPDLPKWSFNYSSTFRGVSERSQPSSYFSSGFVTLIVGPKRKRFDIHKGLLCDRVPYFDSLFNNGMLETSTKEVEMKDKIDDPGALGLFIGWLYRGNLPQINASNIHTVSDDTRFPDLPANEASYHGVYYLADKWHVPKLMNEVMERLVQHHKKPEQPIHVGFIVRAYEHSPESSMLRRYLAEGVAFQMLMRDETSINMISGIKSPCAVELLIDIVDVYRHGCKELKLANPNVRGANHKAFHVKV